VAFSQTVIFDMHTSATNNTICRNEPFTLYMTPLQNIRYVFQYSEDGGPWTAYTNLSSDVSAGTEVSQSITLVASTQFRVYYTTNTAVGSTPNTVDPTVISITVNQLPAITPITFPSNLVCQNSDITYSNATASGVWTSSNTLFATVGATGIVHGVSQGTALIKYIVTDPVTGCKNQDAKGVTVNPTPSISSFTDAVCSGVPFINDPSLTGGNFVPSVTTYTWGVPSANATGLTNLVAASNQSNINSLLTNTTNAAITATYTITASRGACTSTPFNLLLTVTPKPYIDTRVVPACSGSQFTDAPINSGSDIVPINTFYSWSAPTASGLTGFTAQTNQSNFSGILTNSTNAMISVSYTVSTSNSGCIGSTYTATVNINPTPSIASKSTIICSNTAFNIVIPTGSDIVPVGTTYSWAAPTSIGINGLQFAASVNSVTGVLSNTTNAPINVDYNITPSAAGCVGSVFIATVTVNPVPVIVNMGPTQTGSGSTFNFPIGTGGDIVPTGTTYLWSSPVVQSGIIGAAASGTPSPTSLIGTLTNPTGGYLDATYTITPTFSSCVGNTFKYVVRVYPKPIISNKQFSICSGVPFVVSPLDGNPIGEVVPSGTTYTWLSPVVVGITGTFSGTTQPNISGTLINTTNGAVVVTYTVTPIASPQAGLPFDIVITVNPLPNATIAVVESSGLQANDGTICSDASATLTVTPGAGASSDYNYTWNTIPIGFLNPGNVSTFATNIPTYAGSYGVALENKITHCTTASTISTTIVVNTIPNVGTISGTVNTVCVSYSIPLSAIGNPVNTTEYWWYTSTSGDAAITTNPTVSLRGVSPGTGSIAYSVLDQVGCMSNRSNPYNITVYALPLAPIVTPVNVVYDGLAHQVIGVPAIAPFGTDVVEWYFSGSGGSALSPIPSITNAGSIIRYAQSINNTTGCKNLTRVQETVNITTATLTVTAKTFSKTYDAIPYTSAGLSDVDFNGFVNGETSSVLSGTLSFTGSSQGAKNVGTYVITPRGYIVTNYSFQYISGTLNINAKSIGLNNTTVLNKVYDATDNATLINGVLTGVEASDISNLGVTLLGKFPSKNVGNSLLVTSTSVLTGTASLNYTLLQPTGLTGSITEKSIDIIGLVTADKIYDATNFASVTGGVFLTAIAAGTGTATDKKTYINDDLQIVPSAYFNSFNVANNIGITSTTSLTGLDRLNYTINPIVLTARNITAKTLTMFGLSVPVSKTYDATTSAIVTDSKSLQIFEGPGTGNAIDGKAYQGDVVSLIGTPIGTYNSKDVLTASSVSYSNIVLTGAQSANYTLTIQSPSSAAITAKTLTMSGLSVTSPKVYDGNRTAIVIGSPLLQNKILPGTGSISDGKAYLGDVISFAGTALGTYNSKNVLEASAVSFSGLSLSGAQAANYDLAIQSNMAASIITKNLTVTGSITADKIYDGTLFASLTGGQLQGIVAPDNVILNEFANFVSKDVANNILINSSSNLSGSDASNYNLIQPVVNSRNINPKALTMFGLSISAPKTYDGTTNAVVTGVPFLLNAEITGTGNSLDGTPYNIDQVSIIGTPIGTYNSKDVLTANNVSFSGLGLTGINANNYTLTIQSAYTSNISPKGLTMYGLTVPASKVYDGNTSSIVNGIATLHASENVLTGSVLDGIPYAGDNVIIAGVPVGNYNSKNVETASLVKYSNLNLSGNEASNYFLIYQSDGESVITPLNINVKANTQSKVYGDVDPIFTYINDPVVIGDNFTGGLSRDLGENVGSYAFKIGNLSLGSNYTITFTSDILKIATAPIVIKPNPVKRTYGDLPLSLVVSSSDILVNGLKNNELIASVTLTLPSNIGAGNSIKDSAGKYLNAVNTSNPIGGTAVLSNYEIVLLSGDLIVEKFKINVIADPKSKRKLQVDPALTYAISKQLIIGDSLTGNLKREVGEEPGFYKILQGSVYINDNYDINFISNDLEILTIERVIVVPNAFTPNGDGLNDVIKVIHNSTIYSLNYFKIYNRAGKLIFETKNIDEGWDGKLNGSIAESDAYYWLAEYNTWDNLVYQVKGSFILIN
jgi:gliding motility-associated-like protein